MPVWPERGVDFADPEDAVYTFEVYIVCACVSVDLAGLFRRATAELQGSCDASRHAVGNARSTRG